MVVKEYLRTPGTPMLEYLQQLTSFKPIALEIYDGDYLPKFVALSENPRYRDDIAFVRIHKETYLEDILFFLPWLTAETVGLLVYGPDQIPKLWHRPSSTMVDNNVHQVEQDRIADLVDTLAVDIPSVCWRGRLPVGQRVNSHEVRVLDNGLESLHIDQEYISRRGYSDDWCNTIMPVPPLEDPPRVSRWDNLFKEVERVDDSQGAKPDQPDNGANSAQQPVPAPVQQPATAPAQQLALASAQPPAGAPAQPPAAAPAQPPAPAPAHPPVSASEPDPAVEQQLAPATAQEPATAPEQQLTPAPAQPPAAAPAQGPVPAPAQPPAPAPAQPPAAASAQQPAAAPAQQPAALSAQQPAPAPTQQPNTAQQPQQSPTAPPLWKLTSSQEEQRDKWNRFKLNDPGRPGVAQRVHELLGSIDPNTPGSGFGTGGSGPAAGGPANGGNPGGSAGGASAAV